MEENRRDYEVLFLYDIQEELFRSGLEDTKAILTTHGASIVEEEDLGRKKLAYEINKTKDGHYYFFKISIDGRNIRAINDELKLKENVYRHMFTRIEKKFYRKG